MDLERLKEFVTIAEEGSFQKAAQKLKISPSVLSARFQGFEQSVNTRLFYRNNHYVRPTEKGAVLLDYAKDFLFSWNDITQNLSAMKEEHFFSLSLQLYAQTMPSELGPFLDLYCRKHPRLFLDLYDDHSFPLREGLFSGKTDVAFAPGLKDDFMDIPGRIPLVHFHHVHIHVPNDHRLAEHSNIRFQDLKHETWILYPDMPDPLVRELQLRMLEKTGIPFRVYEQSCSFTFHDLLVPIGKGIRFFNWNSQLAPNSKMLTVEDSGYDSWLYLLYNKENPNPVIRDFIDGFLSFRRNTHDQ